MSAIDRLKNRAAVASGGPAQIEGSKPIRDATPTNIIERNKLAIQQHQLSSKHRSSSSNNSNLKAGLHQHGQPQAYQNLSRKTFQPNTNGQQQVKKQAEENVIQPMKKLKLSHLTMQPVDNLTKAIQEEVAVKEKAREIQLQIKQDLKEVKSKVNDIAQVSNNANVEDDDRSSAAHEVRATLSKLQQKIASAQRKMNNFQYNKQQPVSTFEAPSNLPIKNNSELIVKTDDHSDKKNTQKSSFSHGDSTAPMTAKITPGGSGSAGYEASQFSLNGLGESARTPNQFQSKGHSRVQDTDEDGNRMSIMPSAKRPKPPTTRKKSTKKSEVSELNLEEVKGDQPKEEGPKTALERMQKNVKEIATKAISKPPQERTNFVKLNMLKSYKPRMRGAAFSNKIMAKKRNQFKARERFKRSMQIERAKNRDQVNIYGGLGKVGFDHNHPKNENGEEAEEWVPGFSASAMKYVKGIVSAKQPDDSDNELESEEEPEEECEDFLAGDLEEMQGELQKIDEELKEDSEPNLAEGEVNFDRPLYKYLPRSDEDYRKILEERFGHPTFKEGQLEAIKILLEKKENALVVLATGGGKSLVYQYVSMFLPGLVLLVTPLISLMTDQLGKLADFIPGAAINSQQSYQMKRQVMQAVAEKKIKVLFISPERFFIEDFSKFGRPVSMVCVDEIHCASEWSHNFRPAYLKINDMIREKCGKDSVVLGLTATATKGTQKSICDIFGIKHPEHIVTQPDLSRMNLQLSITRDTEKQRGLITLLKSDSFKKLDSILIFATHKRTCDLLAQYLTQNGINTQSYHAGKTDQQRQTIQKLFINNQIRALVCTIAFSMGIDKSDIQSVIHYDMPKSIENYVQEIGRAGRDGTLARCHLFLNNEDFFLLRRLILTDLLDNYNALKLTNKIVVEGKKALVRILYPEMVASKKRKLKNISKGSNDLEEEDFRRIIEEFEHEDKIAKYYKKDTAAGNVERIALEQFKEMKSDLYVFMDAKETCSVLDLKREVVMTMLNSLEKLPEAKRFFKFEGILPGSVGIRFHKCRPQEMAESNDFLKTYISIAKEHQGVFRVSMQRLAFELQMSPFQIPKILFNLQNADDGMLTYEMDQESFILKMLHIPSGGQTLDLSQDMLTETRRIERNMVQKLNCMYFVARRVSMPSIDNMMKREKNEDAVAMYMGFSKQLNELINLYFGVENEDELEIKIAGDEEERKIMMPLQYIDSHREKANVEVILQILIILQSEIKLVLRDFHDQGVGTYDPNERMKPLDIVKILMGIYSDRGNIKRFMNNSKVWAKFQEYDYEDIYKVAQSTVNQYYLEHAIGGGGGNMKPSIASSQQTHDEPLPSGNVTKKRKLNE